MKWRPDQDRGLVEQSAAQREVSFFGWTMRIGEMAKISGFAPLRIRFYRLEVVFKACHDVAGFTVERRAVAAHAAEVLAVGKVVEVEIAPQVAAEVICSHQPDQCVGLLLEMGVDSVATEPQCGVVVDLALPGDIPANGHAVEGARQAVGGCLAEDLFRLSGADLGAVLVFGVVVGKATLHVPVGHQFARDFHFKTTGRDPGGSTVGGGDGHIQTKAIGFGDVVLEVE